MQAPDSILRDFIAANNLTQAQIADMAGVSQATVSRALQGKPERRGRAWIRLFIYVSGESKSATFADPARGQVLAALGRVWDGSDAHAAAIARIIDALAGLRPSGK